LRRVIPNWIKSALVIGTAVGGCRANYINDRRPHFWG
jgi:hypothetical protein